MFCSSHSNDESHVIQRVLTSSVKVKLFFSHHPLGKVWEPKQKPLEARKEDVTTLDPELEEALSGVTDTELSDLAGERERDRD